MKTFTYTTKLGRVIVELEKHTDVADTLPDRKIALNLLLSAFGEVLDSILRSIKIRGGQT